jgi:hypothetical protein
MKEDFETRFPNPSSLWMVFDNDGAENGEYYWGTDDFNPYQGEHSAWCARSGANGLDPENNNYPNNCNSWMVHGPFSLRNAIAGTLEFSFWLRSELGQDWLSWLFSTDGMHFSGTSTSGNVGEWQNETINLAYTPLGNLIGTTSPVWIAFIFTSNSQNRDQGAFIDNIRITKVVNPIQTTSGRVRGAIFPIDGDDSLEERDFFAQYVWTDRGTVTTGSEGRYTLRATQGI